MIKNQKQIAQLLQDELSNHLETKKLLQKIDSQLQESIAAENLKNDPNLNIHGECEYNRIRKEEELNLRINQLSETLLAERKRISEFKDEAKNKLENCNKQIQRLQNLLDTKTAK